MQCFATFLVLFVVGLWGLGGALRHWSRRTKRRQLLSQLSRQFRGAYHAGSWFSLERVVFRYGETSVMISSSPSAELVSADAFQVHVACPQVRTRCEIVTRSLSEQKRDNRARIWRAIDLDGEFSAGFQVFGPDAPEVRQLLTTGVRWQVERLASIGNDQRLQVKMRDGHLRILKPWLGLRVETAAQIVQGALELSDQCALAKASGIQFLRADEAQLLEQVTCKVCGEEIQDQMVVCVRCKTPHHHDCWQYVGGCSVFGCRETNYS